MAEKNRKSKPDSKTRVEKAPAKKAPAEKAPAEKTPAKKAPAKPQKHPLSAKLPRISVSSNIVMLAVKGTVVMAAMFSLLMLVFVRADLRPTAIMQGAKNKYAFSHASGVGFPVEIPSGKIIEVSEVTKGTAVLTSTRCTVYDAKGREVSTANHMLPSPAMKSAGGYILLYGSLGKDYMLRTLSAVSCKGEMTDSIVCADVSESGEFAFVTTSETNNARLVVCSPEGKVIHKWKSVNYKIADVALSPSGKYVALCGYSTQNGVLVSTVIVQQVGGRENLKEMSVEGTLIVDIQFNGNASVVAVGDELVTFLSVKNDQKFIYGYNDKVLNCYDISEDGELALVFSDHSDGRNASVVVIDDKCREKARIETAMTAPKVDLADGRIHLLYQSEVSRYDFKGNLLSHSDVEADCQTIFTSSGKLLARGIMYLDEIC